MPTYLPAGFGLRAAWNTDGTAGGSNGAIWTDSRCGGVTLEIWPDGAGRESPTPDARWFLVEPDVCVEGKLCLDYHAHVGDAAIDLSFIGVPRQASSLTAAGIHI